MALNLGVLSFMVASLGEMGSTLKAYPLWLVAFSYIDDDFLFLNILRREAILIALALKSGYS